MSILIIAKSGDATVNQVIDWLSHFHATYTRVDAKEFLQKIQLSRVVVDTDEFEDKNSSFNSIWFRNAPIYQQVEHEAQSLLSSIKNNVNFEYFSIYLATLNGVNQFFQLSRYDAVFLNKFYVISAAQRLGIKVPRSIITNSKKDLKKFNQLSPSLISKALGENIAFTQGGNHYAQYTKAIDREFIDALPDFFLPTFFQQKLEKEFDIRIFFIEEDWYSIAIFSDSLDMKEDYPHHRYIPIKLPDEILGNLKNLMQALNLNTGSIDMVKEKGTSDFYFLEVNPNGQIGPFSKSCNIQLEKLIASKLVYYDKERKGQNP